MKLKAYICALHAALFAILLAVTPAGSGQMSLLGAGKASAGGASFSLAWTGVVIDTAGGTSVNYASVPIGVADANRVVAVAIAGDTAGAATSPVSTVTIGGISATQVSGAATFSAIAYSDIWYASVPTGTTATVAVTYGTPIANSAVQAYRIITTTPTPSTGASGTAVAQAISNTAYTVPAGGGSFNVYVFRGGSTGSDTVAWTNASPTSNGDNLQQGIGGVTNSNPIISVAHTTGTGSITVSAAITGPGFNNNQTISAAAWGP